MAYEYEFNMEGRSFKELSNALDHQAKMFNEDRFHDEYSEQIGYLLNELSKTIKETNNA